MSRQVWKLEHANHLRVDVEVVMDKKESEKRWRFKVEQGVGLIGD
jgi:hypothetical protein